MRELGLTIRMAVASTVLLLVYAVVGLVFLAVAGIWGVVLGVPLLILLQYLVKIQLALWKNDPAEITRKTHPEVYERAEHVADNLGIKMPKLYLVDLGVMNAFALGRRGEGKVFLSKQLLQGLSIKEIEPIIAHEFAHLKNRDSVLMGLGTSMVTIVTSVFLVFFWLASYDTDHPWLVRIVGIIVSAIVHFFLMIFVMVISRYREYVADELAVRTTGRFESMRTALRKVNRNHEERNNSDISATRSAISFVGFSDGIGGSLFATHPSVDKRISRIEELETRADFTPQEPESRSNNARTVEDAGSIESQEELSDQQLIAALQSMDEYDFERLIGDLWSELGWETTVTSGSVDRGVDVIAERDTPFQEKQIIQAKRYSSDNPVSSSEVQQYAGLYAQEDNVDAVVVVTTGRFTSNAREAAADSNVKLVDGEGLCEMIREAGTELFVGDASKE